MQRKRLWGLALLSFLFLFSTCVVAITCAVAEDDSPQREAEKAEERRKGFHCLSPLTGHHRDFERLVKDSLNDPDSMKSHETRIGPVNEATGVHVIVMEFGARNAFGGMLRRTATGLVSSDTCEPTLLGVD